MAYPAAPGEVAEDEPRPTIGTFDAVALIVGIVVGAAIFETPSLVAANSTGPAMMLGAWLLGGLVSILGALCYAELASAFPHAGGDYHYLRRAYGNRVAFLFAWARMSVIQTGSIALLAFVFGDYMTQLFRIGTFSPSIYAALAVIVLTALNVAGIRQSKGSQRWLTSAQVLGILVLITAGLLIASPASSAAAGDAGAGPSRSAFGLVMVFVLLTYGGWNEAAYLSAELQGGRRSIVRVLAISIGIITAIYVLFNLTLLHLMTREQIATSEAIGADLMRLVAGDTGAVLMSLLVSASALSSVNAVILTGGRSSFAMGRDFPAFAWLGRWSGRGDTPRNALIIQGAIALALVGLGTSTRSGFKTMVDYTAPVFWLFLLLTAISLFVLRRRDPDRERPFRVPLYPVVPILFAMTCAYLLYSSLAYTGLGAGFGVVVLLVGGAVLLVVDRRKTSPAPGS